MSTSNIKFRTGSKESPTEPFKRAVTSALRAIAKQPELEVTFAAERPGLSPGKARLPEPARKLTRKDAAIVRGHADSIALRSPVTIQRFTASWCQAIRRRAACSMPSSRRASRPSARSA